MLLDREEFLSALEAVAPGLTAKEEFSQSDCIIFKDSRLFTFNDFVSCSAPSYLPKQVEGAAKAKDFLKLLQKIPDSELEVDYRGHCLLFKGKAKTTRLILQPEIKLPMDQVDVPKDWRELDDDFCDAMSLVQECAGNDPTQFIATCVHLHPEWLEASDNHQVMRFYLLTGISEKTLVRRDAIKNISSLAMEEISETEYWIHFKNKKKQILSCRKFVENYPDFSSIIEIQGRKVTLPSGLEEVVERAGLVHGNQKDASILVKLSRDKLVITGESLSSGLKQVESKKISWDGEEIHFLIYPKLLSEVCKRHNHCEVSPSTLTVDGGKWKYTTFLGRPE